MWRQMLPALRMTLVLTVLTGLLYPGIVTGLCQMLFPNQANGSLLTVKDAVVGSSLIGQNFASDKYFHARPSATQTQDPAHPDDPTKTIDAPYNAANSTGSNLGPTSQKLIDRVKADVAAKRAAGWTGPIPADSVTTSASGLDPHISPIRPRTLPSTLAATNARSLSSARPRALATAGT